ncbi:MAG: 50S ribosomal protein L22 [Candidatus Sungbacteria bacterium]|nr:50S ribosomal protein L22 [Candidatus Sungbacteria bacterium]
MEIKASLKNLHIAPRKVRLVAGLIKGKDIGRAEVELVNLVKRSSNPILKLLRSAAANAAHNFGLPRESLYIKEIKVDAGQVFKRFRARAFGRAAPIRKRTSHVSLILESREHNTARKPGPRSNSGAEFQGGVAEREISAAPEKERKYERDLGARRGRPWKTKPLNFVRRVFNRKAI